MNSIWESMVKDTAEAFSHSLCYVGLSIVVLALSYIGSDIVTPGKLGNKARLLLKGNRNVAVMTSAHLMASSLILLASIWVTHEELGKGLLMTGTFGLLGAGALVFIEWLVNRVAPALLTEQSVEDILYGFKFHPLSAVIATIDVVFGLIIAVSIL